MLLFSESHLVNHCFRILSVLSKLGSSALEAVLSSGSPEQSLVTHITSGCYWLENSPHSNNKAQLKKKKKEFMMLRKLKLYFSFYVIPKVIPSKVIPSTLVGKVYTFD